MLHAMLNGVFRECRLFETSNDGRDTRVRVFENSTMRVPYRKNRWHAVFRAFFSFFFLLFYILKHDITRYFANLMAELFNYTTRARAQASDLQGLVPVLNKNKSSNLIRAVKGPI